MNEIIFVTQNLGKQKSAQRVFENSGVVVSCYEYDYKEPTVNDIEFIAENKVKQAYEVVKKPCISIDAGFYIRSYPDNPDFPGAFPKRDLLDTIGIEGLLDKMKDVEDRYCYFKECLAYFDGDELKFFYSISEGDLTKERKGIDTKDKWSDLWYIFKPKPYTKTLAEMTEAERKNRVKMDSSSLDKFRDWYVEKEKDTNKYLFQNEYGISKQQEIYEKLLSKRKLNPEIKTNFSKKAPKYVVVEKGVLKLELYKKPKSD